MLAPDINSSQKDLTQSYQSMLSLDGFATTISNLRIVILPKDPDWLPLVRNELKTLRTDSYDWLNRRPDIWSRIPLSFISYGSTFKGVADTAKASGFKTKEDWIKILEGVLLPALRENVKNCKAADAELRTCRSKFSAVLPQIDKSIQVGWTELGKEEKLMLKLAGEIGELEQLAASYGAKLTSDVFSGGKSYVSSSMSLLYAAAAAGAEASIPIIGIATTVFAIGKSFYDIIEDNQKLIETMTRVVKTQEQLSNEAQGLALTKGTLQVLYNLEKMYLASRDALPAMVKLWSREEIKVTDAINALKAGASPDQYLDLLTLDVAETNWQVITQFVQKIMDSDFQVGPPVTLDIAESKIKPGLLTKKLSLTLT